MAQVTNISSMRDFSKNQVYHHKKHACYNARGEKWKIENDPTNKKIVAQKIIRSDDWQEFLETRYIVQWSMKRLVIWSEDQ